MNKTKTYNILRIISCVFFIIKLLESILYFYNFYSCSFTDDTKIIEIFDFIKDFIVSLFMTFFWYKLSNLFKLLKDEQKIKTE